MVARRLTVCMVATSCLSLMANLWMRNQPAAAAVQQEPRWSALSQQLELAALATPFLASPPPSPSAAAAPSPTPSSPALSSAAPQSDGGQPRKEPAAAARSAAAKRAAAKRVVAKRVVAERAAAERAAAERAAARRPAFAPGGGGGGGAGRLAAVDTEDGVRQGSRCRDESDKRTRFLPRCPDASDIVAELDAEAAREAAAGEAAGEAAAARAPVSPVTSPRSPVTIAHQHAPLRACVRCASARGASPATTACSLVRGASSPRSP